MDFQLLIAITPSYQGNEMLRKGSDYTCTPTGCWCVCGGVGETFRYLPQFLVVVILRGLNKLQLHFQFGNVREEISPNDVC